MITTLRLWFESLRRTLTNLRALGIFIALYALLLVSFYFFISTREATVWQVLVTYALLLLLSGLSSSCFRRRFLSSRARLSDLSWKKFLSAL